jgi:hypothetical protein
MAYKVTISPDVAVVIADKFPFVGSCIQPEHDLRWFIWKEWGSDLPQGESSQDQQRKKGEVCYVLVCTRDLDVEYPCVNG